MKIFKIIIFNIVLVIVLFFIAEFVCAIQWFHGIRPDALNWNGVIITFDRYIKNIVNPISADKNFDTLFANENSEDIGWTLLRRVENPNVDKPPILFCGCSFTYGELLNEDETISAQFGKILNRPIYNMGMSGWGLSHFLYLTKREDFYERIPEPEYLIYTYIDHHLSRLDKYKIDPTFRCFQPKYEMINGSLTEVKPRWFDRFYLISNFQYNYEYHHNRSVNDAKIYFEEAAKEIRKHWKNTKLIILDYPTYEYSKGLNIDIPDYKIIHLKDIVEEDLLDPKYRVDAIHPKASTWEFIIPKIMENIGIEI